MAIIMAAESNQTCQLLADQIADLLCGKIQAGPDVIDYINGTCGDPTFEEIKALIEEPGGSERETLVELIFFPDESIQLQIEKVLERKPITSEAEAAIAADLENRSLLAAVALEDSGRTLSIRVDRGIIDPFLKRLNIAYIPDADMDRTLAEELSPEDRRAVRVRLRNARTRLTGRVGEFLHRYIRAVGDDGFFFEGLDFLLEFLEEIDSDADIFEAMMKKNRKCRQLLNQVAGVEEKFRKSNFEILFLLGERYPYIDRDRTLKTVAAIDRICLSVFGRTEAVEALEQSADGWEIRGAEDAAAMIRRLSS